PQLLPGVGPARVVEWKARQEITRGRLPQHVAIVADPGQVSQLVSGALMGNSHPVAALRLGGWWHRTVGEPKRDVARRPPALTRLVEVHIVPRRTLGPPPSLAV